MFVSSLRAHNISIASAVWYCTELEALDLRSHPALAVSTKAVAAKTSPSYASLCQISKSWSIFMKPSILLIWVAALEQSSKQSCDLRLLSHERGGQLCWQRDEPLIALLVPLTGLSDGDGEYYWTTAHWKYMKITELSTLRRTTQTALLTSQVAGWQQVGERETERVNRLHLF